MNIKMELSHNGIVTARRMLLDYENSLQNKLNILAERLASIGVRVASTYYNAGMDEGKNYDYDVTIEPTEKGCKLVANGEDVCFLEFGAGVSTRSWQGEGQEGLPPIYPGSWSETEGVGQFANQGYWIYGNELYKGIEPTMGMYHASKQMLTDCIEEARKVFEK